MLVIMSWHVLNIHSPWTDTWTLTVFFIVMGVFYKQVDFSTLVQKKTKSLLVPWVFFSVPDFIVKLLYRGPLYVVKIIVNPYDYIHAGSWFVICTLWIYIIAFSLYLIKSDCIRAIITWFIIAGGFLLSDLHVCGHRAILPLNLHSAICMFLFFEIGRTFKLRVLQVETKIAAITALMGLAICAVDIIYFGGVKTFEINWVAWKQNVILMIIRCIIGCVTILSISKLLPKIPILSFMGKYSLVVLLSHFYFITILKLLGINGVELYILTIVVTLIFTYLSVKYIPQLVGVSQKTNDNDTHKSSI